MPQLPQLPLPDERKCPFGPAVEYAELRETAPITKVLCPTGITAWLVSRYADAREILGDPKRFSNRPGTAGHILAHMSPDLPVGEGEFPRMDGAEHVRFRRAMAPEVSTLKRIDTIRPRVQQMVDERIDALAAAEPPVDLVAVFARPLTTGVIAELIGVPEDDRILFQNAADALFDFNLGGDLSEALQPLFQYLYGLVLARRAEPGDDALSRMIVRSDETERPFTDFELVVMAAAMLIAGYDTTASMIGHSTLALLEHPDQLARLREDPTLAAPAVEELVRYLGAGTGQLREVTEDTVVGGQAMAKGDYVVVAVQSANFDPELREDADVLDVTRPPAAHIGFGYGPHQCVGQQLARLELTTVFSTLPRRIPSLRLAVPLSEVEFKTDTPVRGPASLPVTWDEVLPAAAVPA